VINLAYSESQKKAVAKYNTKAYDELKIRVPKGKKQDIEDVAKAQGESINGYVKKALKSQIKADMGQDIEL